MSTNALSVGGTTNFTAGAVGSITSTSGTQVFDGELPAGKPDGLERDDELRRGGGDAHELHGQRRDGAVHGHGGGGVHDGGKSLNNLSLIDNGAKTVTVTGGLTLNGNLEVQANQALAMGANNLGVTGTTNAVAGGVGTIASGTGTQIFTGSFQMGSLTASSTTTSFAGATVTFTNFTAAGGTLQFTGAGAQSFATNGQTIYNMTVNNSGGATITLGGNLSFAAGGTLTLTKGVLDANGNTITLGANLSIGNANAPSLKLSNGELTDGLGTYNVSVGLGSLDATGTGQIVLTGRSR